MTRFLLFAFTSLLILTALFNLGVELAGGEPELGPLVGWQEGGPGLPGGWILASWALEALALTALFQLAVAGRDDRGLRLWLGGLLTGWIAWVFRGPLLVLAAVGYGAQAGGPWWRLSLRWFALYTLAGLTLAAVAHWTHPSHLRASPPRTPDEPRQR